MKSIDRRSNNKGKKLNNIKFIRYDFNKTVSRIAFIQLTSYNPLLFLDNLKLNIFFKISFKIIAYEFISISFFISLIEDSFCLLSNCSSIFSCNPVSLASGDDCSITIPKGFSPLSSVIDGCSN